MVGSDRVIYLESQPNRLLAAFVCAVVGTDKGGAVCEASARGIRVA